MNNFQVNKFTADKSASEITFSNTSVQRQEINEELTLDVQTHYKENETFQYTNFYLSHPPRKD